MSGKIMYQRCAQCDGSGVCVRPPVRQGNSISWAHSPEECEACEGFGVTVTDEGRAIRDLVMAIKRGPKGWH